jgi:hypothetical protein
VNVVKVIKLNDDGSVAFEGHFSPEEAKVILDVGINVLLSNGLLVAQDEPEDDDDDIMDNFDPDETVHRH